MADRINGLSYEDFIKLFPNGDYVSYVFKYSIAMLIGEQGIRPICVKCPSQLKCTASYSNGEQLR